MVTVSIKDSVYVCAKRSLIILNQYSLRPTSGQRLPRKNNRPSSRIRTSDLRITPLTLQSSALPTELPKEHEYFSEIVGIDANVNADVNQRQRHVITFHPNDSRHLYYCPFKVLICPRPSPQNKYC